MLATENLYSTKNGQRTTVTPRKKRSSSQTGPSTVPARPSAIRESAFIQTPSSDDYRTLAGRESDRPIQRRQRQGESPGSQHQCNDYGSFSGSFIAPARSLDGPHVTAGHERSPRAARRSTSRNTSGPRSASRSNRRPRRPSCKPR